MERKVASMQRRKKLAKWSKCVFPKAMLTTIFSEKKYQSSWVEVVASRTLVHPVHTLYWTIKARRSRQSSLPSSLLGTALISAQNGLQLSDWVNSRLFRNGKWWRCLSDHLTSVINRVNKIIRIMLPLYNHLSHFHTPQPLNIHLAVLQLLDEFGITKQS